MNTRSLFAATLGLGLVAAAIVGGWYVLRGRPPAYCELSGRPIHANMHTLVGVDGKRRHACCAQCALILSRQSNQRIEILEVTDYAGGRSLPAEDAYYVEGSRVEVCSMPRVRVDESRTPYLRLFDRCAPSLLAFAREAEARAFIAKNGGRLRNLEELMRAAGSEKTPAGDQPDD